MGTQSNGGGGGQRFCLRWNNHQSNLLSVFDQLLHDEAFVDVTLAVDGRLLRAHKMVLSACSPYFQSLFVGHPDRHPIVILKDVPYADMRSLLDFMYRGEVSVDQERLTAFLKVAESLRIKGLTEVNEERCDLPSIASSLLGGPPTGPPPPPPPSLHRIHPAHLAAAAAAAQAAAHAAQKRRSPLPHPLAANPLLGSALTAPQKRKRGRPRKLSGGGADSPALIGSSADHLSGGEMRLMHPDRSDSPGMGPPDLLEVNMGDGDEGEDHPMAQRSAADGEDMDASSAAALMDAMDDSDSVPHEASEAEHEVDDDEVEEVDEKPPPPTASVKQEPTPGTSNAQETDIQGNGPSQKEGENFMPEVGMLRLVPHRELMPKNVREGEGPEGGGDRENNNGRAASADDAKRASVVSDSLDAIFAERFSEPPARPAPRRRVRRRATSSSDPAEQLTEMSVRGLNLFRYASVSEGVYKCTECEKSDILKTFKNKYSFQRHAFLYHEGHQRKVFPCPVCSKEFSRPDKMKNHMKTVHDCFMPKDCVFPPGPVPPFFMPP